MTTTNTNGASEAPTLTEEEDRRMWNALCEQGEKLGVAPPPFTYMEMTDDNLRKYAAEVKVRGDALMQEAQEMRRYVAERKIVG